MILAMRPRLLAPVAALALVAAADGPVRIPLQPGLTIVTALADREGDYESIKTVEAAAADTVKLAYSADIPASPGSGGGRSRTGWGSTRSARPCQR